VRNARGTNSTVFPDYYGNGGGGSLTASYNNSPRRADTETDKHESAVVETGTIVELDSAAKFFYPYNLYKMTCI
jgi:hypothetical protein